MFYAAADAQAVGPGWNVLGQLAFTHTEYGEGFGFQTGQSYDDLGFVVQGGVYASRHLQVFLRYDQSIPDGKPRDPTLDPFSGGTGTNDFRTLTSGFSYYLIPGNTLGRLTVDLQYMFDAQTTSLVAPVFNSGVFESTGSQWSFRLQWVARL